MSSLRTQFLAFDDTLARLGVLPLTKWWREGIGEWLDAYESRHALELWACVGRGAAKSTAMYKLALFFALFGDFAIPPGEVHYAICLSRLKEEASKGIAIIDRWLTLLGVGHRLAGDVIELANLPRGLRVVAASVAATSGWRAFFTGRDERSKWGSDGAVDLDAEEIDTSAVAMTATHRFAPTVTTGSAWGNFGSFFDAINGGSDASRTVLGPAPTWVAAPHISREDCARKERDPRRFAREYACEFQSAVQSVFDPDDIERAFACRPLGPFQSMQRVLVLDPSSGKKDSFSWGLCGWDDESATGRACLSFDLIDGLEGVFWQTTNATDLVARLAGIAKQNGVTLCCGDQREEWLLRSTFGKLGLAYIPIPWTAQSKPLAVETVRRWLRESALGLPPHERMKRELQTFEERLSPGGAFTFGGRGNANDDYVALLITAAMVVDRGLMPTEPADASDRSDYQLVINVHTSEWATKF